MQCENINIIYEDTSLDVNGGQRSVRTILSFLSPLINAVQHPGISSLQYLLKHTFAGVIWVCRASLALSSTDVSPQLMGWWLSHAISAMTFGLCTATN